ncbi:MAG: sigma-70 family RNA polymerase sigma factor [Lachnospiraceae bacterium]|jgi:RNA polymerase sporulation-specific sigma factor|nr:sigma-70 family RNA polymerase sigma factor [Lachnospiraceae bacterium]
MNSKYIPMSDEELIMMLRDGDRDVEDYLCNKYKDLVRRLAGSMYILGAEKEDLIQEGMIGLFKAVRDYDSGRDASFITFANLCITRQMYNAIQSSNREKNIPLNTYVSLFKERGDDAESMDSGMDELPDLSPNPEQELIDKENVEELLGRIYDELSPFETQVLELHLTGMGYIQIAKVLGRDEKSADNALQRIRSKIKKIVDK